MKAASLRLPGCASAIILLISSAAGAADLPARPATPAPILTPAPAFSWTGFYVGVNAGYGFAGGHGDFIDPTYGSVTATGGSRGGFLGGGQVGFNYQFTPGTGFVVGLEADIQAINLGHDSLTYTVGTSPYYNVGPTLDWFGTVRGRAGYAFDRLLVYGTGGFAYGGGSTDTTYSAIYPYTLPDSTRTGYAVGAGIEYAFTSNITAKVEGLYINLDRGIGGSATYYDAATDTYYGAGKPRDDFAVVRAGLNFKFSPF